MEISNGSTKQYDHLSDWFHEGKVSSRIVDFLNLLFERQF